MPSRGEVVLRHVEAGDDLHHSGDLLRLRCVHRSHISVGDIRMKHLRHIYIAVAQIIHILRAPGHLLEGVHPFYTLSDNMLFFFHTLTSDV